MQAERDGDGEVVEKAAQSGAFLVHVDEDFAETPVVIFAGAQEDGVAADLRLLGITLAAAGQLFLLAGDALDDALDDALGDGDGLGRGGGRDQRLDGIVLLVVLV